MLSVIMRSLTLTLTLKLPAPRRRWRTLDRLENLNRLYLGMRASTSSSASASASATTFLTSSLLSRGLLSGSRLGPIELG